MTLPDEILERSPNDPGLGEVIRSDHRGMAEGLARLVGEGESARRAELFEALARQLSIHETAEEEVLYPAVKALGDEGYRICRARLAEEGKAKSLLVKMMRQALLDPGSGRFRRNIERLSDLVAAHAAAEEAEVLPLLESNGTEASLRIKAKLFLGAKATAPTRPHPHGPDRLAGLIATGPVLAVLDRLRDGARRLMTR